MTWEKLSWGVPCNNRLGRTRVLQGRNKGRYGSRFWIRLIFMVSLSILRCGRKIIVSIEKIRPLGPLPVWDKLAWKGWPDWPDGPEGPWHTGRGRGEYTHGSGQQIGSSTTGSWDAAGVGKRRLSPISLCCWWRGVLCLLFVNLSHGVSY